MRKIFLLNVFFIWFVTMGAHAKDLSNMYSIDVLSAKKQRYAPNIQWNWDNLVIGSLTWQEKSKIGGVSLEFPVFAEGKVKGDPMAFYSSPAHGVVTIPILSVKFLDDLSIAFAWLEENGYSTETVLEYLTMLKYSNANKFPGRVYPDPLKALCIPANALDNPRVDDLAQKILKSAIVWIMAHELGHVYFKHAGYGGSVSISQKNEIQSDAFATEIMRRVGVAPAGMAYFFLFVTHWVPSRGDFASDSEWNGYLTKKATHPLTSKRMQIMANDLNSKAADFSRIEIDRYASIQRVKYIASQIEGVARILGDLDFQKSIKIKGLMTDLEALRPRKPGELFGVLGAGGENTKYISRFEGTFLSTYGHILSDGRMEKLPAVLVLSRLNNIVSGEYYFGLAKGTLEGAVQGNIFNYKWKWGNDHGKGTITLSADKKSFSGDWGYGDARSGGGTWSVGD